MTSVRCTATPPPHTQQDNTHKFSKFLRHLIAGSLRAQVSYLFPQIEETSAWRLNFATLKELHDATLYLSKFEVQKRSR